MNEIVISMLPGEEISPMFKILSGIAFIMVLYYLREKKYTRFRKSE